MPDTRDLVFDRVSVDYLHRGGARVSWRLFRLLADPGPYTFRLQYSEAGVAGASDWVACGAPVADGSFAVDPVRRGFGKHRSAAYRVLLETPLGAYASRPAAATGVLSAHDWNIAREILRQNRLRLRLAAGVQGWLFRRRLSGPQPDPRNLLEAAIDPIDRSAIRSAGAATAGTPYLGGYFAPAPLYVELSPASHREMLDLQAGTVDPAGVSVTGFAVQVPEIMSLDVFVAEGSDRRFYVNPAANVAEWRGVPLLSRLDLRVAPANDIVYTLPLPSQYADAMWAVGALAGQGALPRARVIPLRG